MDKKLFGSILIVLVLISCLWVFAALEKSSPDTLDRLNVSSNGTVPNWSSFYKGRPNGNITVNVSINPNFTRTLTGSGVDNITSISIDIGSSTNFFNMTDLAVAMAGGGPTNSTGVCHNAGGLCVAHDMTCAVTGVNYEIFRCVNGSIGDGGGDSNVSGNATINVWFLLEQNKTSGTEALYNWIINVSTNTTVSAIGGATATKTIKFGIDDLAPRIKELNISDGRNVRQSKSGHLNGTKTNTWNPYAFLNKSDINVTIILTEYNRDTVKIYWNRTWPQGSIVKVQDGLTYGGKNGTMVPLVCTTAITDTGTQECLYSFTIKAGNFTPGYEYSIVIWTNDSFDQQSNFTNAGIGYNFTVENYNMSVRKLELSTASLFSTNAITVTCVPVNVSSGTYSTAAITITKPSGKKVVKTVAKPHGWSAIFKGDDTNEAGTYKADCVITSAVGNTGTAGQETFRTYFLDTGGEAPTAEEEPIAKIDISTVETPTGLVSAKQGQSETFTIDGVTAHTITFLEVGITSAKIRIESEPIEFTLNVGEYRNVDLTGDGVDDIKVTLKEIDSDGLAKVDVINLVKLEEQRTGVTPELDEVEAKGRVGLWMTILIILIIIGVGYYLLKGKKGKKGEVKFSKQDLGL